MLTREALRVLDILIRALPNAVPGRPDTYLGYKQVHDLLGLEMAGPTYGESLKKQGLETLAQWTVDSNFPAITGLVIDQANLSPGRGYYRVFGKTEDFVWWEDQIRSAKSFDWSRVIDISAATKFDEDKSSSSPTLFPSTPAYVNAFEKLIPISPPGHLLMLREHYYSDNRTITATMLARSAGYKSFHAANLQYGIFAQELCNLLQFVPPVGTSGAPTPTFVLAAPYRENSRAEIAWVMRSSVAAALDIVFSAETASQQSLPIYSDEVNEPSKYIEGATVHALVNRYERDADARKACLDYWGNTCCVCDMDFYEVYGLGAGRGIHVHHLTPLSEVAEQYLVDPINHLRPVCPNCHAVLHSETPPIKPEVLRKRLRAKHSGSKND